MPKLVRGVTYHERVPPIKSHDYIIRQAINYFRKTLHLRCLTRLWIRLWELRRYLPAVAFVIFYKVLLRNILLNATPVELKFIYFNVVIFSYHIADDHIPHDSLQLNQEDSDPKNFHEKINALTLK